MTMFVTDASTCAGICTEVVAAVFVTEVWPVGKGLFTVTLNVVTMV